MSIVGVYHVYSLPALKGQSKPIGNEFSVAIVTSDEKLEILGQSLTNYGTGALYSWRNTEINPTFSVNARLQDWGTEPKKILVGTVQTVVSGNTSKDAFVAIKAEYDRDVLLGVSSYDLHYQNSSTVRDLAIAAGGSGGLSFSFKDPSGNDCIAEAPEAQTPGRFNANKTTGDYSITGFRLPRFLKVVNGTVTSRYAVIVGHLVKGTLSGADYDPTTEDIEPFVAVAKNPIVFDPPC
ncbi:MAG TPA: hypothetical protein VLT87_05725 [Thermoanaerobaculia bacterium]|nr:hypothetical protein [Thermoanaerobaculia bacterium]